MHNILLSKKEAIEHGIKHEIFDDLIDSEMIHMNVEFNCDFTNMPKEKWETPVSLYKPLTGLEIRKKLNGPDDDMIDCIYHYVGNVKATFTNPTICGTYHAKLLLEKRYTTGGDFEKLLWKWEDNCYDFNIKIDGVEFKDTPERRFIRKGLRELGIYVKTSRNRYAIPGNTKSNKLPGAYTIKSDRIKIQEKTFYSTRLGCPREAYQYRNQLIKAYNENQTQ